MGVNEIEKEFRRTGAVPDKSILEQLASAIIGPDGKEYGNPKRLFEVGLRRPLSIKEQIQQLMRVEMSKKADEAGFETFDEANDFDVDDDDGDPISPYEVRDMIEEFPIEKKAEPANDDPEPANDDPEPAIEEPVEGPVVTPGGATE